MSKLKSCKNLPLKVYCFNAKSRMNKHSSNARTFKNVHLLHKQCWFSPPSCLNLLYRSWWSFWLIMDEAKKKLIISKCNNFKRIPENNSQTNGNHIVWQNGFAPFCNISLLILSHTRLCDAFQECTVKTSDMSF